MLKLFIAAVIVMAALVNANPTCAATYSMERVRAAISERKSNHRTNDPFILWLHSLTNDTRDVFKAITLASLQFHLSFTDINRLALYYPHPTDRFMEAINRHADQDGTHIRLILHDFQELGMDNLYSASDILAILYSPLNTPSRDLVHKFIQLAAKNQHPGVRYGMMESIEEQGNVLFSAYFELVKRVAPESEQGNYYFFGEKHLLLESGHLVNQGEGVNEHELFNSIELTEEQVLDAVAAANATWDAFEAWQAGMLKVIGNVDHVVTEATKHLILE